jgi:hypothetical protein
MRPIHYLRCFGGIANREWLRFLNQRGRFFSALVRPLVWLAIFATGIHFVLGVSIIPPYETYVPYAVYNVALVVTPENVGISVAVKVADAGNRPVGRLSPASMKVSLQQPSQRVHPPSDRWLWTRRPSPPRRASQVRT